MKTSLILTLTAVALLAGSTFGAEDGKKPKPPHDPAKRAEMMLKADGDGDGKLSKAEFGKTKPAEHMQKKGGDEAVDKAFGRMDTNSDGFLDKEELSAPPPPRKGEGKPKDGGKHKEEGKTKDEGKAKEEAKS